MGVTADQLKSIRDALGRAKTMLGSQKDFIDKVTSPPLQTAVVVQINSKRRKAVPTFEDGTPSTLNKIGTRVRLIPGSRYQHQPFSDRTRVTQKEKDMMFGAVSGQDVPGWVKVKFDNEYENIYCVGIPDDGEPCDLEIVNDEMAATCYVSSGGSMMEVWVPEAIKIEAGDLVSIAAETSQIVDKAPLKPNGTVRTIRNVIDNDFSEMDGGEGATIVFNGKYTTETIEGGDRVILDPGGQVVIKNLGKDESRFSFTEKTGIEWKDIGGLKEAKEELKESVELPHQKPEIFAHYGKKPIKGVLLYGPPGCGKTMLGKATATSIAKVSKTEESKTGFIYIKGPEILDRYVGVAEATIRQVFNAAREHRKMFGYPAVVFIDEADAIMQKRGSGISSDVEKTIVPMFLTEMDGLDNSGALIILATNRSDSLDPAIVRDGRIDRKILVGRPDVKGAIDIFKLYLKGKPFDNGFTMLKLAKMAADSMYSDDRKLYVVQVEGGAGNIKTVEEKYFTLAHIANGGMIAGIVDKASSYALQRDLRSTSKKPTGIRDTDLIAAIDHVATQNRDLNHQEDLEQFVYDFRDSVVGINRAM